MKEEWWICQVHGKVCRKGEEYMVPVHRKYLNCWLELFLVEVEK
jgi:hypothetical protein